MADMIFYNLPLYFIFSSIVNVYLSKSLSAGGQLEQPCDVNSSRTTILVAVFPGVLLIIFFSPDVEAVQNTSKNAGMVISKNGSIFFIQYFYTSYVYHQHRVLER